MSDYFISTTGGEAMTASLRPQIMWLSAYLPSLQYIPRILKQLADNILNYILHSKTCFLYIPCISEYGTSCTQLLRQKHFMFFLYDYHNLLSVWSRNPLTVLANLSSLKYGHILLTFYDYLCTSLFFFFNL